MLLRLGVGYVTTLWHKNTEATLKCCYASAWAVSQHVDTSKKTEATLKEKSKVFKYAEWPSKCFMLVF